MVVCVNSHYITLENVGTHRVLFSSTYAAGQERCAATIVIRGQLLALRILEHGAGRAGVPGTAHNSLNRAVVGLGQL